MGKKRVLIVVINTLFLLGRNDLPCQNIAPAHVKKPARW